MSQAALSCLKGELGDKVLATSSNQGDDELIVGLDAWHEAATIARNHADLQMNHFIDLSAVDYPERCPQLPRFDVYLALRSHPKGQRIRIRTRLNESESIASLCDLWLGANWAEREVYDMFGIRFEGHPDLRRILMYEEFEGHPLRKDYPIERTQPLVPYRDVPGISKLAPFGVEEGQPWGRIDWAQRVAATESRNEGKEAGH